MIKSSTVEEARARIARWKQAGAKIGLVPTMGALHDGHLSLIDIAKARCDKVVASLFVNPLQFAPHEDFDAYPRDYERDFALFEARGADLVFSPPRDAVFAPDFSTSISVGAPASYFEGADRPQFFGGVATIVAKLFMILTPDAAVFGEKDFQQLVVIKRLVRDLNMPIEIIGAPTIREADGLAMSSRNQYLSARDRDIAPGLQAALRSVRRAINEGAADAAALCAQASAQLLADGFDKVDYIALTDAESMAPIKKPEGAARLLGAAWIGKTRLIDNIAL